MSKLLISKHPMYNGWAGMKQRCMNVNNSSYKNYGGRGITICDRWLKFENYLADMGERPAPGYTVERIDNNGDYTPENCRWATRLEQTYNRRRFSNNKSGYTGVSWHKRIKKWVAQARIGGEKKHLGYFDTPELAHQAYITVRRRRTG